MRTLRIITLFLTGLIGATSSAQKFELPFPYPNDSQSVFESFQKTSQYVPMPDGTQIAVDFFLPAQGPDQATFPVLFLYTPYQRAQLDRKTGKISDLSSKGWARWMLTKGYALICADMRGTGASTGWLMDFMPQLWSDGKEVVDWIAAQTWCDGNVGMMGGSYLGWSQTATASQLPRALKCIVPAVIPLEGFTGEVYPGGIYLDGFMKSWSHYMYYSVRNMYLPGMHVTSAPAVDEDGDGELSDEIPLDLNGDGSFLDEPSPPTYSDGNPRQHIYFQATREHHEKNYDYTEWTRALYFYDGKSPLGFTVSELGPTAHIHGIIDSKIPVYHIGAWFDGFTRGSFELFATMQNSNPSKLIVGPGYHDVAAGPFWQLFGYSRSQAKKIFEIEHLRFFDLYLKGIDNGIDREPPILIYVMNGKGWRFEKEWPPKRHTIQKLFLGKQATLNAKSKDAGHDRYRADYTHRSMYGSNGGNRWLGIAGNEPDSLPSRNQADARALCYQTQPLERDMEVTGHPVVTLWLTSTADYGDIFVYLSDVDPAGKSVLVTEGQLRAGFAGLYDNDQMIETHAGIDVLPDLPWHGFKKQQYTDKIFANGNLVTLTIDFHPTSWVFKKGHQLRLSIACSDFPTFRLHPKLCPANDPDDPQNIVPEISVHYGGSRQSCIELPVIP
ncbi:CocE/NonD family hydrolase [candidate division KSB1 bacterium]|nr:CocE/NonD family hydrolase [candidate division KSB1 bacterium]